MPAVSTNLLPQPVPTASDPRSPKQQLRDRLLEARDREVSQILQRTPVNVRVEATKALSSPDLLDLVSRCAIALGMVGDRHLFITVFLVAISRLLTKPLAAIIQGSSSSGKSHVCDVVVSMTPAESVVSATSMTPKGLLAMDQGSLMHCLVPAGERTRRASDLWRQMLSGGELTQMGGSRDPYRYQPGPIAFTTTTTSLEIFDEDANRCLLLSSDESAEQTRRVIDWVAATAAERPTGSRDELLAVFHAAQRMLQRVHVVVPYAAELIEGIPVHSPNARRATEHTVGLIRAVSLLCQRQRSIHTLVHGDTITATIDDYARVRPLLLAPMARSLGRALPDNVNRFAQLVAASPLISGGFSVADAMRLPGAPPSRNTVIAYLRQLEQTGQAVEVSRNAGRQGSRWTMTELPQPGSEWLPTVEELERRISVSHDVRRQPAANETPIREVLAA